MQNCSLVVIAHILSLQNVFLRIVFFFSNFIKLSIGSGFLKVIANPGKRKHLDFEGSYKFSRI